MAVLPNCLALLGTLLVNLKRRNIILLHPSSKWSNLLNFQESPPPACLFLSLPLLALPTHHYCWPRGMREEDARRCSKRWLIHLLSGSNFRDEGTLYIIKKNPKNAHTTYSCVHQQTGATKSNSFIMSVWNQLALKWTCAIVGNFQREPEDSLWSNVTTVLQRFWDVYLIRKMTFTLRWNKTHVIALVHQHPGRNKTLGWCAAHLLHVGNIRLKIPQNVNIGVT